jgi:hypothetical protein
LKAQKNRITVPDMGNISKEKKYGQVLLTETEHEEMAVRAVDLGFHSFSAWAAFVLRKEYKMPKHLKP